MLQGRDDHQPVRRGITRVRELLDAGVNVACGQDDMRNMFYPLGQMDMLEVANFVAHAAHLSSPAHLQSAFDMPRYNAARVMRLSDYGVNEKATANLVLFQADSTVDAISRQPVRSYVIRNGKVLVQNKVESYFNPLMPVE